MILSFHNQNFCSRGLPCSAAMENKFVVHNFWFYSMEPNVNGSFVRDLQWHCRNINLENVFRYIHGIFFCFIVLLNYKLIPKLTIFLDFYLAMYTLSVHCVLF